MTKHIKITTFEYADEAWQEGVTLNKYYEVANESDSRYSFINDNNMLRNAYKDFPMYQITDTSFAPIKKRSIFKFNSA